jgi:hypothetical protein
MSHSQKRLITDHFGTTKNKPPGLVRKSGFPEVPDELRARLTHVGMKARKALSDGYKQQGSLPSYRGQTIGPTDPGSFSFTTVDGTTISSIDTRSLATNPRDLRTNRLDKRSRDDTDGDTDVEEDIDQTATRHFSDHTEKRFYPPKIASIKSPVDDFNDQDCPFLAPMEDAMKD